MPATCTITCAACVRATPHTCDQSTMRINQPWYIGPKGGNTRKGHAVSTTELASGPTLKPEVLCDRCSGDSHGLKSGPKGGFSASKGQSETALSMRADKTCL